MSGKLKTCLQEVSSKTGGYPNFCEARMTHSLPSQNHIYNNRSTKERCHGIEREDALFAREEADKVAQQSDDGSAEDCPGEECLMVSGMEQQTGHVRYGQSDERYRTAEGRRRSGKKSDD